MKRFRIGETVRVRRYEAKGKVIEKIGSGKDRRYKVRIDSEGIVTGGKVIIEHPNMLEHLGE